MEDNPRAVVGDNNPPTDPKPDRTFKRRWAHALFSRADKPAGAVAMGFKLYMEMDGQGRGATVSDAEFQVSCGVSDGSCRVFKRWLVSSGFIQILVRGRRGYRSEFLATIPKEHIAADNAAWSDDPNRRPIPVENVENNQSQPAITAGIPSFADASRARLEPPSGVVISNNNNKLASSGDNPSRELAGLNGAADLMLNDILGWMPGATIINARQWLGTTLHTFGDDVTAQSYQKLQTDMASGKRFAWPLQAWSKIAQRMKADAAKGIAQPAATEGDADAKAEWQRKIIADALGENSQ